MVNKEYQIANSSFLAPGFGDGPSTPHSKQMVPHKLHGKRPHDRPRRTQEKWVGFTCFRTGYNSYCEHADDPWGSS
jgi:hypothetical protein